MDQPATNEYQRVMVAARNSSARTERPMLRNFHLSDLPPYNQTPITEWGACLYAKSGEIKAKSWSGLVTYYTRHPVLDWEWLQRVPAEGWVICPMCGLTLPHTARYWWKDGAYLRKDKCRDCACKSHKRHRYRGDVKDLKRKMYRI